MLHGISYIEVDNSKIQDAIANKASKDHISFLKAQVSWSAVYGFSYTEVPFKDLANIISNDYGFSPFKYKSIEEGAIYNKEKHPKAYGRVRGRSNLTGDITWLCLDVDDTALTDTEMHTILANLNHHIARTSNASNAYKYRILLELPAPITLTNQNYKYFIKEIAKQLNIKVDNLGPSQCYYGYANREVLSVTDKHKLDPSIALTLANREVERLEELRNEYTTDEQCLLLDNPYTTFTAAYEAKDGEGYTRMKGALSKAKLLGASKNYLIALANAINDYWQYPMPRHRFESTILTFIDIL
jgi:hypothetical protein